MADWIIYYGDGSECHSSDCAVEAVPGRNVQVIAQLDPDVGWHTISGHHNYWWRDGLWYGGNDFGLFDYMVEPGWKKVLYGRTLLTSEFEAIRKRAEAVMGEKNRSHKWERKA